MAFKTFTASTTLPAADVNTYLMKQAVIVCTSGTRPGSPVQGMTIYETDTDLMKYYNGSVWRAFYLSGSTTATTSAGGSITVTHGLGTTPTYVSCQHTTTPNQALAFRVSAKTSTTFDVNIRDCSTGAVLNTISTAFDWLVH